MPARNLPNILLICTDQQRFDSLGCYGNRHAKTPNIDRVASEGAVFENCYVQNPICGPSRASLMTGEYPHSHGLWANGTALPPGTKLFSRSLGDAGYDCGLIGKLHLSPMSQFQTEQRHDDGFRVFDWAQSPGHGSPQNQYIKWLKENFPDHHRAIFENTVKITPETNNREMGAPPLTTLPVEAHFSHWVAERAISFISQPDRPEHQPFFLIANFFDPHHPFGAPEEVRGRFEASLLPPPKGGRAELENKPALQKAYSDKSYGGSAPGFADYTAEQIRELRAAYYAMIALVDDEVGRILACLEASGRAEDTLVIFTSDHGEMLGDHAMMLKGPMMYDPVTRVPLIMRWPGEIPGGIRRDELVQWIDLSSTMLDAAGMQGSMPRAQGRSLLDLARGQAVDWRDWALCEYRDSGHRAQMGPVHTTMLRWQKHKLVVWHGPPISGHERDGELYDLETDPDELNNLYHDDRYRGLRMMMYERLVDVMADTENRSQERFGDW